MSSLSAKEAALIAAARKQVGSQPSSKADDAFPPTVIGWDHPAAQTPDADSGKWAQIAAMMAAEQEAAQARRARLRRACLIAVSIVGALIVFLALRALLR